MPTEEDGHQEKAHPTAAAAVGEHAAADAPDPDEDDLDDLDEMLDEFSATKIDPSKSTSTTTPSASASGPGRPSSSSKEAEPQEESEEDFSKQLQAGMEEMLQEFESNPEMAKQFEEMMASLGAPPPPSGEATSLPKSSEADAANASSSANATSAQKPPEEAFQDTIRRTMERMRESSTSAAAAAANPADDDIMASLLKELSGGAGGEGSDDTFSKMLLGMMEQLTNKDILYEPMKELKTKFPAWLEEHKETLSKEDEERYLKQQELVKEIVARFERKEYKDENAEDREYIVGRMQKMQEAGAPPPDLVGDTNVAQEMLADLDNGCPQQ